MESKLTKKQTKNYGPKPIDHYDKGAKITAKVRFDDECVNGHNTFAITGNIVSAKGKWLAGGCLHDEIAKAFPELAKYIKWHLCSTDGPMHGVSNTLYHAGDKDCWGRRKGDPSRHEFGVRFGDSPVTHRIDQSFSKFIQERMGSGEFHVVAIPYTRDPKNKFGPHYTLVGYGETWYDCPFRDPAAAEEFCQGLNTCKVQFVKTEVEWSEGKERELDLARSSAIWPEATDEELMAPDLKEKLEARMPALLAAFKADVEELGFTW